MKILALELSTARGSLAWLDTDSSNTEVVTWPNDRKDSGPFFDHLQRVIREFGLPGKIIVGFGPGSYAGVRIAISAAIGLQAAATSELVGYPSVCAMETSDEDYVVIGDARRKSFFFVTIRARNVAGAYELLDESALQDRLRKIGLGRSIMSSDLLPQFQTVEQRFPSAEVLARLAADPDRKVSVPPLEPIYLREANVTIPKPIFKS